MADKLKFGKSLDYNLWHKFDTICKQKMDIIFSNRYYYYHLKNMDGYFVNTCTPLQENLSDLYWVHK